MSETTFKLAEYTKDLFPEDLAKIERIKQGVPFTIIINPTSDFLQSLIPTDAPDLIGKLDNEIQQLEALTQTARQINTADLLNAQVKIEGEHMFLPLPVLTTVLGLEGVMEQITGYHDHTMLRGQRSLAELTTNAVITAAGLIALKKALSKHKFVGYLAHGKETEYVNIDLSAGEQNGDNNIRYGAAINDLDKYFAFMREFYSLDTTND